MAPPIEISRISTKILLSEPFYGHFMLGMPKTMDTSIDTACVSLIGKNLIKLSINPSFWELLKEEKKYGLIKHEILHVVFKHLFILKRYGNKALFNIAADLVVNQYIKPIQLPEGALMLSTFTYLKPLYGIALEPFQATDYYYKMLMKAITTTPNQSVSSYEEEYGPIAQLKDLIDQNNEQLKKHHYWQQFQELTESEVKIMEYALYNQVKNVMDRFQGNSSVLGHLPASLVDYLNNLLNEYKPKLDWKRILRKFAASSNSTYLNNTIRRPSKRYGTSPGISVKRRQNLLIALDTSGSLHKKALEAFFYETHFLWRQGAVITIVECDVIIQKKYAYNGEFPNQIKGRGGTNFNPPIVLANKEVRPDGIIYFTDGFALPPTIKSKYPILWVITPDGIDEQSNEWEQLKGQKIKVNLYD